MADIFKHYYNQAFIEKLANDMALFYSSFDKRAFVRNIFVKDWDDKELKDRMRHVTATLYPFLPKDFQFQLDILIRYLETKKHEFISNESIVYMFVPDFVEQYGMEEFDLSVKAMERITCYTSCEFAVRPFIIRYGQKMIDQMEIWSKHEDYRVRRLASEGCRPRLPWAMALPALKKDPAPILALLDRLKDDPNEWVRRSVANNLNDISKDHPDRVMQLFSNWIGKSKELDWVVKHGCRTLLKQGDSQALQLFGFAASDKIKINALTILTPQVRIGDDLLFSFSLENSAPENQLVRLEYGLYYMKANGSLSRKVFKISEKEYSGSSMTKIERKQSFRIITTRKFYTGLHSVSIIVNGEEKDRSDFELIE